MTAPGRVRELRSPRRLPAGNGIIDPPSRHLMTDLIAAGTIGAAVDNNCELTRACDE